MCPRDRMGKGESKEEQPESDRSAGHALDERRACQSAKTIEKMHLLFAMHLNRAFLSPDKDRSAPFTESRFDELICLFLELPRKIAESDSAPKRGGRKPTIDARQEFSID